MWHVPLRPWRSVFSARCLPEVGKAPARGTDLVITSVFLMMFGTQSAGNAVDRLATVSLAGAFIFMGGFELSDWLGWPTGIQNTAGILMAVFSAVCMARAWKIDARG